MRIGLYGMPTSGKSYILDRITFMETVSGSRLLREYDPGFDHRDGGGREEARRGMAAFLQEKDNFIMDGHYAFGDETAFTEQDGQLYDVFLYLYAAPAVLETRMQASEKNRKYLKFDIEEWQNREIAGLRNYCHEQNKDFYVVDYPPENLYADSSDVIGFIREITEGYSCVAFAKKCADEILRLSKTDTITLFDGDRTLTVEDTSKAVFGYKTLLFEGNFYTGYQVWKQSAEFAEYAFPDLKEIPVGMNERIWKRVTGDSYILTSGHERIWQFIGEELHMPVYCGVEMAAETKYYITKMLQNVGKRIIAYGDGMNDYFMLKRRIGDTL